MQRYNPLRTLASLMRATRGATAVEYAMLAPVLMLLLVGIIEYNAMMYAATVLEGATAIASRQGKTGYVAAGMSQQDYIYGIIQDRVTGILTPSQLTITSKSYANLAVVGDPEPCISPPASPCTGTPGVNFVDVNHNGMWDADQGTTGLGASGDIVVYTVTYPWKIMTPIMLSFLGTNGTFTLTSSSIVRNEPYTIGVTR